MFTPSCPPPPPKPIPFVLQSLYTATTLNTFLPSRQEQQSPGISLSSPSPPVCHLPVRSRSEPSPRFEVGLRARRKKTNQLPAWPGARGGSLPSSLEPQGPPSCSGQLKGNKAMQGAELPGSSSRLGGGRGTGQGPPPRAAGPAGGHKAGPGRGVGGGASARPNANISFPGPV